MAKADQRADATPFIEFMLRALRDAIREAVPIDQVSNHVTDQVAPLLTRSLLRNSDDEAKQSVIACRVKPIVSSNRLLTQNFDYPP